MPTDSDLVQAAVLRFISTNLLPLTTGLPPYNPSKSSDESIGVMEQRRSRAWRQAFAAFAPFSVLVSRMPAWAEGLDDLEAGRLSPSRRVLGARSSSGSMGSAGCLDTTLGAPVLRQDERVSLSQMARFKLKPGVSRSPQNTHHRAERWIIVKSTAESISGDKAQIRHEKSSHLHRCWRGAQIDQPRRYKISPAVTCVKTELSVSKPAMVDVEYRALGLADHHPIEKHSQ